MPLALLLVILPLPALAGATLLDADTTWTGTVTLAADTLVGDGVTLTIAPGTRIEMGPGVSLEIDGTLVARGDEDAPIVFAPPDDAPGEPFESIHFTDTSEDAVFREWDEYVSGSILEHCVFEGGGPAVRTDGASPYLHACLFRGNAYSPPIATEGGAALYIGPGSSPRVRACDFVGNDVGFEGSGGAVYVEGAAPILQENTFSGNRSAYGGAMATVSVYSPIVGNAFEDNTSTTEGGAVSLYSSSPAVLDNLFTHNQSLADGGGVHVCTGCLPHAAPAFFDDTFTENEAATLGGGGAGMAWVRQFARNNLTGNQNGDGPADFAWRNTLLDDYPEWVTHAEISGNWWGTTDPSLIAAAVIDGGDDPQYGETTVEPALSGPVDTPSPRAVVTTGKLAWSVEGEPMSVYLTLYNPGPARTMELRLFVRYAGLAPIPFAGPIDAEGVTRENDSWSVAMPEDAVLFLTLAEATFVPGTGLGEGTWIASLRDPADGADQDPPSTSRFLLDWEER